MQQQGQIQETPHADIGRHSFAVYIEIRTAIEDLRSLKNGMKPKRVGFQHVGLAGQQD